MPSSRRVRGVDVARDGVTITDVDINSDGVATLVANETIESRANNISDNDRVVLENYGPWLRQRYGADREDLTYDQIVEAVGIIRRAEGNETEGDTRRTRGRRRHEARPEHGKQEKTIIDI